MPPADRDQDPRDSSLLHRAAADGDLTALDRLAGTGALNRQGAYDMTPLMTALVYEQDDAAARLLELGADVNLASSVGSAPLMTASVNGSIRLVELLLERGAEVNYQPIRDGVAGWSALLAAAHIGHVGITLLLLGNGADRTQRNAEGRTPVDLALELGHAGVVAVLIRWPSVAGDGADAQQVTRSADPTGSRPDPTAPDRLDFGAFLAGLSDDDRRQGLITGIMNGGQAFLNTLILMAEGSADESPEGAHLLAAKVMWARWLMGERLTDRVDEAERRLAALDSVIIAIDGEEATQLMPALGRAVLALPTEHPRHDEPFALSLFLSHVKRCAQAGEPGEFVLSVIELIRQGARCGAALTAETVGALVNGAGQAIDEITSDPTSDIDAPPQPDQTGETDRSIDEASLAGVHRRLRGELHEQATLYFICAAVQDRDAGDTDAQHIAIALARANLQERTRLGDVSGFHDFLSGVLAELDDQLPAAAAAYERAAAPRQGDAFVSGDIPGRVQLQLGHYARGVELLEPELAPARGAYLGAIDSETVASTGEGFASVATMLAFACALSERWDEALQVIDQCKSLRLRYRQWLRQAETGDRVVEIEAALDDIDRGLEPVLARKSAMPDLEEGSVRRLSLILEDYRRAQPASPDWVFSSPSVRHLGAALSEGEGVIVLATSFLGTMLALVVHGDTTAPAAAAVLPELTRHQLADLSGDWRRLLTAPAVYRSISWNEALRDVVTRFDAALGEPIRSIAQTRSLSRLTIVPHSLLHSIPFWALPSLEAFDIAIAPSVEQLLAARTHHTVPRRAAVVGDPTLDLPFARVESSAVVGRLAAIGVPATRLVGRDADERRVESALNGAGLLHFGGHGRGDALTASRAALLLHPQDLDPGEDPIEAGLREADRWSHSPTHGRYADLSGGRRLYNINYADGDGREYFLERPDRNTLWARYVGAERTAFAELWRAGDMTAERQLADCMIVFMSACDIAGGGSIYDMQVDERRGIPGALALTGIPCTIGSLWPVADELALVYVELFYAEISRDPDRFDAAGAVRRVARRVRDLSGDEAAEIVRGIGDPTGDIREQFRLDALTERLAGEARPFSDPIHWAAFFVTGACDFSWARPPDVNP